MWQLRFTRLAITLAIITTSSLAYARDSTWLLCKGIGEHGAGGDKTKTHIVVNLLEHRAPTGDSRDLSVTLIYGAHVNVGEMIGKKGEFFGKAAPLTVSNIAAKPRVTFSGTGELATNTRSFTLKGSIDPTFGMDPKQPLVPFSVKLVCEELDDMAIKP